MTRKYAKDAVCAIEGCNRPRHAREWCRPHYARWWHLGDPLAGGTYSHEPTDFIDNVAIKTEQDECLRWPFSIGGGGYGQLWYSDGQKWAASRLVCELVNGPAPTPEHQAAHSCGNRWCVNKRHLRWATVSENHQDKYKHGTMLRGEKHHKAKLTEKDVLKIRALAEKMPRKEIAKMFNVAPATIGNVVRGDKWGWLEDKDVAA